MAIDPKYSPVKETIEVLQFGFDLTSALKEALTDNKIGITDLPAFFTPLWEAKDAFTGLDKVPGEIKSKENRLLILDYFSNNFDIPDKALEVKIEKTLNLLGEIYDVVLIWES